MTFQEFLEKYNGKYVDFDGVYGPQCVDLCRQYLVEVLAFPNSSIKPVVGAKDMYEKYDTLVDSKYFDKIPNTPTAIPEEGDIVLWGSGTYGHVALYVDGDVNRFRSFDQNYPSGSPCHIQEHNYSSVLGWLRPKQTDTNYEQLFNSCRSDRDSHWNTIVYCCDKLGIAHEKDLLRAEVEKLVKLEDDYSEKSKQLEDAKKKIEELEAKIVTLSFNQTEMISENQVLQEKLDDSQKKIEEQGREISGLSTALQELKNTVTVETLSGWKLIAMGLSKLLKGGE